MFTSTSWAEYRHRENFSFDIQIAVKSCLSEFFNLDVKYRGSVSKFQGLRCTRANEQFAKFRTSLERSNPQRLWCV